MASFPIASAVRAKVKSEQAGVSKRWKARTFVFTGALAFLSLLSIAAVAGLLTIVRLRSTLPSVSRITSYQPAEATRIFSSDGVLLARLQMENRKVVSLNEVSPYLIKATIAVEDARFYEHGGFDLRGILRAAWANATSGDSTGQGGSTITQQLARNVSEFQISREKTLKRKLREVMTAARIEQALSKDEILHLYLNQIYYGSGAYGVEAAARTYFGKPASKLTLAESALLAGLPQRPDAYSPYKSPREALKRRGVVLARMLDTGKIPRSEYESARCEPLEPRERKNANRIYRAPHFVDWVVDHLTRQYGMDGLYSGLTVVTTLNWKMQQAAESAAKGRLGYGATQAAIVSIDPHNGHVRAMVGSRDYQKNQFNAITQGLRQPGSAFKPIVYAAAFDSGVVDITSRVMDQKLQLAMDTRRTWTVHNYRGGYGNKDRSVLDAIRYSINTIAVDVGLQTGLDRIIAYAHAMGINSDLPRWPSLTLGAGSVRPIELCAAYGVFAANGERYQPTGVVEVKDGRGRAIYRDEPYRRCTRTILSLGTIDQLNFALRETVLTGSGHAASRIPNAFGKTGTTTDHRDAWFVGYTPDLVTAVWTAAPHRTKEGPIQFSVMHGGTGGKVAAPVWARFMQVAAPLQRSINLKKGKPWEINVPDYSVEPIKDELPIEEDSGESAMIAGSQEPSAVNQADYLQHAYAAQSTSASVVVYRPDAAARSWETAGSARNVVEASVCADSGLPASEYCQVTVVRGVTESAQSHICRRHRAPAGEPRTEAQCYYQLSSAGGIR